MTLEEIKQFFEEQKDNQEVQNYLQGFSKVTPDGVTAFLETDEGKKLIQPKMDSYFSKGLDTWKANNLKKLVDEEVKKLNPPTNPLEIELQNLKKELLMKDLKATALSAASEQKLPSKIAEFFIGNDEQSTLSNLKVLKEVFDTHINERVQEQLKAGGINPPKDGNPPTTLTSAQLREMTAEQIAKLDPKVVNEALKN